MTRVSVDETVAQMVTRLRGPLTQAEWAAGIGVAQHTVSQWENGKRGLSAASVALLAEAYPEELPLLLALAKRQPDSGEAGTEE